MLLHQYLEYFSRESSDMACVEIPCNASGKVLKKELREPYWEGIERRVG